MDPALLHSFNGATVESAAQEVIDKVHAYMCAHPQSELHTCGKMFGVLLVDGGHYLAAFSAMLDGSYHHDGFVPPVYEMPAPPVGANRTESQRLQRLLFAQYSLLNARSETRNLLDIFAGERPILSQEEWFGETAPTSKKEPLPPSGAGECCAPKLLQYAFANHLRPIALAEFWIGASPKNELRREGCFYPPCAGRCVPILRWMLQGTEDSELRIQAFASGQPQPWHSSDIPILFEDDYLIVANKPAGLLSVPGKSGEPSLAELLSAERGYPLLPAHRLDQDTSGLIVLAKDAETYKVLQAYFQRRDILKRYEAIVLPTSPIPSEGEISLPLLPDPYDRPRQTVNREHGKPSITAYRVREQRPDGTLLVDFYPKTGRTHQIRVHAAHPDGLNAPIAGDRLYGQAADRLYLHAAEIRFPHPVTKEEMHFCIPSGF